MQDEIEVKFVNVTIDDIRDKLRALGAECITPMRLMKRAIIETPETKQNNAFIRVRDEGDKTTLTYKQFNELSLNGAKEVEVTVSDFDATVSLFAYAGHAHRSLQESKRETWRLQGVEIVIDEWPWLNPYIEIEGPDEASVKNVADLLGFAWTDAVFGDVMAAYRTQYPHLALDDTVGNLQTVRFGDPLPELLIDTHEQ